VRHPDVLEAVRAADPSGVLPSRDDLEQELARFQFRHSESEPSLVLRRFKQQALLRIALADLLRTADLAAVTRALSVLADVLLDKAVRTAKAPLEERHGRPTFRSDRGEVEESGFAVIALGKLGGEELNYSSDIDILYLFARDGETSGTGEGRSVVSNREFFTRLAAEVTRLIGGREAEGEVFRVDLNLRPGGRDGDLVMSVGATVAYYRNWAQAWERQALLKARPAAGDLDLGRRFVAEVEPLVYAAHPDPYVAVEIGAMKDRIDAQLSEAGLSERDLKLGRGGIRELEFAVQALQLQRGGADPWMRQGNTLLALHRAAERGLVGFAEYATLAEAYGFLRDLEHRVQIAENRQTALLPADLAGCRSLARALWLTSPPREDEAQALADALERHRTSVRSFYDSVIGRSAQVAIQDDTTDVLLDRLDDAALVERLRRTKLPDPEAMLRPVQALRRLLQPARLSAELSHALRRAGPLLLRAALESANPRRALAHLEKVFSSLLADPESLRRVLEHREVLPPIVRMLGRSDLLAGLLIRQPQILTSMEDRARFVRPPDPADLRDHLAEAVLSEEDLRGRSAELRRRHQAALATIVVRDMNRQATVREVVKGLSSLADAAVEAALGLARSGETGSAPIPIAVLGLGRLGYREIDYGSDLDLVFVVDPEGEDTPSARARASRLCETVVRILSTLSRDGQLYRVDLRLRPSGSKGELVTSPAGLLAYFDSEADVWEMQSFLKARAVAGDASLGARVVRQVERRILERAAALPHADLAQAVRDMRRRLADAAEKGASSWSLKHGPGGLADIDFIIEYLQLRHGIPGPEDKDSLRLLTHLHERGHLDTPSLHALYEGYLYLRSIDHARRLIHGAPSGPMPSDPGRLREVAREVEPPDDPDRALADLRRHLEEQMSSVRRTYDALLPT
jgi:glutamate-ammonia-ligase adenylyltransferase